MFFKIGDKVLVFGKTSPLSGEGVIVRTPTDEDAYQDRRAYVVDFGADGTCDVWEEDMVHEKPLMVGRPINGITINGDEYLLDDKGEVIKFKSRAEAEKYLLAHDLTAEEIEGLRFIEVESE
jgi:hypothetical protein